MTDDSKYIGDPVLKQIGAIAVYWSALESQMELAILGTQNISMNTGMVITSNLGFRSYYGILMTIANGGGLNNKAEESKLKTLLTRINDASPKRNGVIHAMWSPTGDPNVARRMGVRAKSNLRLIDEKLSADDLAKIANEILSIGVDLTDFMDRNDIRPKHGDEDSP